MKRTIFILGRTPELATIELQALYPTTTLLLPGIAVGTGGIDVKEAITHLGGTVKIAEEISEVPDIDVHVLFSSLLPFVSENRITFGISAYGSTRIPQSTYTGVKQLFMVRGISVRYVESKHDQALGSVVVSKQHVTELVVIGMQGSHILGVTKAVQDFEDWNTRDSARPAPDPRRGMLPPKVARMIVNIALGPVSHAPKVLLDPFCGVGTIVAEALMRDTQAIGMDISADAVGKAQKNIAWLRAQYGMLQKEPVRIEVGDATHVSELIPLVSVDGIATEPLLGEQLHIPEGDPLQEQRVKNIIKGLEKLYIGCLKEWAKVLKPGSKVVMATPAYVTRRGIVTVKKVVDRCEILGYTLLTGPIEYSRPQAMVRREFYVFQKSLIVKS